MSRGCPFCCGRECQACKPPPAGLDELARIRAEKTGETVEAARKALRPREERK